MKEENVQRLLDSYVRYYNINETGSETGLVARCDYFEHSEKYVLSKKAELWSADNEEFLYLFYEKKLTKEIYESDMEYALKDGRERAAIGPGHMCSYVTVVIVTEECDEVAVKCIKKSHYYKSFHFSLHGWMDYRAVAVMSKDKKLYSNNSGKSVAKMINKVLYN